ncbi:MFS transporter [Clostridium drakei]|uniref:MFS transporter n=1 Tax=Clostridium drakei TaxID=332101 RepID=A0A2U8DTX6_9CLOT|nr:MFS transporter [Clostridium drakei]AWI06069.1 MFS transporter [Clostridium drakei]
MDVKQIEASTVKKVTLRLIPFLFICFAIAIMDRVNIGFAALTMNSDLGFSSAVFGFGAGIFFIGYFIFEVPGSAMMTKWGARKWIARIMISWAFIAVAMAFIKTPIQFYIVRFFLGAMEASFYPCMVWYLSNFYQSKNHAKAIAGFMLAIPAANAIGSPIATVLLGANIFGLSGWQSLFILEGIPCLILGIICLTYLDDKIEDVKWLTKEELTWLIDVTTEEKLHKEKVKHYTFVDALKDRDVLVMSFGYFCWMTGYYGINMFLPTITKGMAKSFNLSTMGLGWLVGGMYLCAMVVMYLVGNHSDKTNERRFHVFACLGISAIAMLISIYVAKTSVVGAFVALTISVCGAFGSYSPFWSIPPSFLTGAASAGAIALINSIGNLGGFFGPYVVGYIKDITGSFNASMIFLAVVLALGGIVIGFIVRVSGKVVVVNQGEKNKLG